MSSTEMDLGSDGALPTQSRKPTTNVFEKHESAVRTYCRDFPAVLARAKGSILYDVDGRSYIDFFAGAGALNYGHNNDFIKTRLIQYLQQDGIVHALDLHTTAKAEFLQALEHYVMAPGRLDYRVMFCGPTGTNSVEAALKLARKYTGRQGIFSFTGAFHGMSLGSLSVSGNATKRRAAGLPLTNVTFVPYPVMPLDCQLLSADQTIQFMENLLLDSHSGVDCPAAVLFETVQAEGGVNVAPVTWLRALREFCDRHAILMICDEIQSGCGRTGPFFSFERAGIVPDMVTVSKSISGYGAPLSLLLIRQNLDIWKPGEHNGTFRGYQLAMVGGTAALELRHRANLKGQVERKEALLADFLGSEVSNLDSRIEIRGLGMIWGIDLSRLENGQMLSRRISRQCFEKGLIIETAGRNDTVLKLLPPLTIEDDILRQGCIILHNAIAECLTNVSST
jgi:diaminobutyrate-2-oxoglutarate transaminase